MGIRTVVGLVLVGLAAPAAATEEKSVPLSTLVSGDQVRLRLADSRKTIRATIESVTDDEMVVRPPNAVEPLRFSPMQLQSLEVRRGRHSHWRKGALIGLVPGAVLMGAAFGTGIDCYRDCTFDPKVGVIAGAFGGILTGSAGALVGLAFKSDRWVRVEERKPRVDLILAPTKGQMRFGVSVSF